MTPTVSGPIVATPATASPSTVAGTTTALSVLGSDPSSRTPESALSYSWTAPSVPPGAAAPAPSASNGTNAAKNTTATFYQAGSYTLLVTIADPGNLTATSSVTVTVNQTLTTITVAPGQHNARQRSDPVVHRHGQRPVRPGAGDPAGVHLVGRSPAEPAGQVTATGLYTWPPPRGRAAIRSRS